MERRFALDHNFPTPIVEVLAGFQADAELVRIDRIHSRMPELEDWEILVALRHHREEWDGLITTDSSMLHQGPELAALIQTRLTLVVAMGAGHNPVKASGLLFAYLGGICQRTNSEESQVWTLSAANRAHQNPWNFIKSYAEHNNRPTDAVWSDFKLSDEQLALDPLGDA